MRRAESSASGAFSRRRAPYPRCIFVLQRMANNAPNDYRGRYVALGRACTFRREACVESDVMVIIW